MPKAVDWRPTIPVVVLLALGGAFWSLPSVAPATPAELSDIAYGYLKADKRPLAMETLHQALERSPDSYEVNFMAGLIAYQEERLQEAVTYLERALQSRPDSTDGLLTLGAVYQRLQAYDKAVTAYEQVMKAEPGKAAVYYNLGVLEGARGNLATARSHFERYLALAPTAPDRKQVETRLQEIAKQQASRP